ncbi:MAG TPA: hypothetical protein VHB72_04925 [Candidatus Saccharimonadales bacterium]|nr:hypothetical protein [Candidatus Saccharimonadales bacterium]
MHEQAHDSAVEPLDIVEVLHDLQPRLGNYAANPDALAVLTLLSDIVDRKILFSECVSIAQEGLESVASEHVRTIKGQFCAQVYRSYPAGSEDAPELLSPKRFIKENDLDSRIRPELRDAQAQAVADSKERLVTAIEADATHEQLGIGVDGDELESAMVGKVEARVIELRKRIEEIKELMTIVHLPAIQIGEKALQIIHVDESLSAPQVTAPAEPKQRAQLDNAIFVLKKTLQELANGEPIIARQLVEQYTPRVEAYLEDNLVTRYEQLEAEELAELPATVEEAYGVAANVGPRYQPKPHIVEPPAEIEPDIPNDPLAAEVIIEKHIHTIEVPNPFDWYDSETISLTIAQDGEHALVSTAAMPPNIRALSGKLRATDSQTAKKLDDMWARIKEVEFSGEAHNHSLIRYIRANFHNLTLYYFKNNRRNGARMYYAKTKLSQQPELAAIAHGAGITQEDTDLIILLAETDKKNQPKVLQELNAQWRFQGPGH